MSRVEFGMSYKALMLEYSVVEATDTITTIHSSKSIFRKVVNLLSIVHTIASSHITSITFPYRKCSK